MKFVQPIRDKNKIEEMKNELLKSGYKNYLLFVTGINTGLRIGDLLKLKVSDVKNRTHILMQEQKTGKEKRSLINNQLRKDFERYIINMDDESYLFKSRKGENNPISRVQAYRILNKAAANIGVGEVGTHTLRKTFGAPKMGI